MDEILHTTSESENIELPVYLFHQGTNYETYSFLGVHCIQKKGDTKTKGSAFQYVFRVWAPNAVRVCLVGDFPDLEAGWEKGIPMTRVTEKGVWELLYRSDISLEGVFYKYAVTGKDGKTWYKADPYAFFDETHQKTASIVHTLKPYSWHDQEWMKKRRATICPRQRGFRPKVQHFYSAPMHIYEMHLGSWHTQDNASTKDGTHYWGYRKIADKLVVYLTEMGYTHVELLPIMEHPYDGSWGYQICGYYAPTARYGSPEDFQYFVDTMHSAGIGVILDWVPAHFPKDRHGLFEFDGQPCYEYQGIDRMEHKEWGTRFFDVGRPEVQSFLISNALFWLREYHIDGLRVDAVASMLYLDYDRLPGEWIPNAEGNNRNLEAIAFFQKFNTAVHDAFPDALTIAEESTDWPMLTKPVSEGGLGFSFKWNMGFSNDMFDYVATDPIARKYKHDKLTFPLMYAFREQYILPVSHDEVVHGKKSLVDKMFGEYDDKFACMRTFMLHMMTMPGKKLTFMGCEFAQFREWDYENSLEWFMTEYPRHIEMQRFFAALNHFYRENPPLWEIDDSWDGFAWIEPNDAERNIISYRRRDKHGKELIVIINYAPVTREEYTFCVPKMGRYEEVFTTDPYAFGGRNIPHKDAVRTVVSTNENGERICSCTITLPALSGVVYKKDNGS